MIGLYGNKCALAAASTESVSLFSNLSPGAKPIATKSRRFSKEDQEFIEETINNWNEEGVIQPSSSLWRAQVIVVKDDLNRHRKRLCVDYSQRLCVDYLIHRTRCISSSSHRRYDKQTFTVFAVFCFRFA